jgi:hypothetical protein
VDVSKIELSAVGSNSAKLRPKRNSKGYILNELRRRKKQQSNVRHYSSTNIDIREKENVCTMNTKDSIDYLHKQFRVVSMTNRTHPERIVITRK